MFLCLWPNKFSKTFTQHDYTWEQLVYLLTTFSSETDQERARLWSPTLYKPGTTRGSENVEHVSALVLDVDCGIVVEDVSQVWNERGISYIVHSTAHHLQPKADAPAIPRWRAVFPLKEPVPGEVWSDLYPSFATFIIGTAWDKSCRDPARISWLPMSAPDKPHFSTVHEGHPLDASSIPIIEELTKPPVRPLGATSERPGLTPGDDYSERGDHAALLTQAGWKFHGQSGSNELWTRPDKRGGTSATWNIERRVFYCFTSSTELETMRGYSLFQLFTFFNHRGDFSAAARDLSRQHYGSPSTISTSNNESKNGDGGGESDGPPVRVIHITTNVSDMANQVEEAFLEMRPRKIFQRGGNLVRVVIDADPPKGVSKVKGATSIGIAPFFNLYELASHSTEWLKFDKRADDWLTSRPDPNIVKVLMARGRWRIPPLYGIVEAPTLRPDGSIIDKPGYDEDTGIILATRETYPPVPQSPSREDALSALERLLDVFVDFPTQNPAYLTGIIASLLSLVCRDAISGPIPLFMITANAAGTGKSLVVDVISTIAFGRKAARMTQADDESEDRKTLLALAIEGIPLVLIDNINRPLGSGALDAALTSGFVSGRILGSTETKTVPWRAVLFATGNNIQVKGDTQRRTIPIHLDAEVESPEERSGWKHNPIIDWTLENRSKLVIDCVTILRAFIVAGLPQIERNVMGSFEAWDALVRGSLLWLGMEDIEEIRKSMRAEADITFDALRELLRCWYEAYDEAPKKLSEVIKDESNEELIAALGNYDSKWRGPGSPLDPKRIAPALNKHKGRIVNGLRLVLLAGNSNVSREWVVQKNKKSNKSALVSYGALTPTIAEDCHFSYIKDKGRTQNNTQEKNNVINNTSNEIQNMDYIENVCSEDTEATRTLFVNNGGNGKKTGVQTEHPLTEDPWWEHRPGGMRGVSGFTKDPEEDKDKDDN